MQETLWVLGLLIVMAGLAAAQLLPADQLVTTGQNLMLSAAALGVPLELLYFTLLAWALHRNRDAPRGWYWRSFDHHHRLRASQRRWILPIFYLGAFAFLGIVIGIAVSVVGFAAAFGFRL